MKRKTIFQNVKGTTDYLPEKEIVRQQVRRVLEDTFSAYGYAPLETPILNEVALLASKYGGGAEILEEMYTLTDRGARDIALRYDLTIPFAKVIALNPGLQMPFKRYEIGKVFRDGPIKKGRFREFTQCDVDIVGVSSSLAEVELLSIATDVFKKLNLDIKIEINNRKLLTALLESFGVERQDANSIILTIDKFLKIGVNGVDQELKEKGVGQTTREVIIEFLQTEWTPEKLRAYNVNSKEYQQGIAEITELIEYLENLEVPYVFNPYLARGLDIYTGTVFEIFLKSSSISSSIGAGGRYDRAIAGLLQTDEVFPTVGLSFGLDVICKALELQKDLPINQELDVYVIPIEYTKEALQVAKDLRAQGYKVEVDIKQTSVNKALKKANRKEVPQVIMIGELEVKSNSYKMKNMKTGEEQLMEFTYKTDKAKPDSLRHQQK
ncbi:histidine--tRNA ligase [Alkalihalobacillus pseudalcaliphilus]|uniref:histidine--tRNA ligase n=1 Tax=Alkalihalobacillus pseudalcaliphilus TaxID=79884 RepID=UPI00064DBFAD|nr:histidine--tRNA ligase [Alkalihalobacillus pseudalcaliphilus]KMK77578.1 histidine--tRNA ligase [Alkalihalobacillus pseudalcaliphilus]